MRERDGFPAGVPCWVDIDVVDPAASMRFYGGLFGWQFDDSTAPGADGRYFVARVRDGDAAGIGLRSGEIGTPVGWNTYVCVDSVEATLAKVREAGGSVVSGPEELEDAATVATCSDAAGALFRLWQPRDHRGVQRANEPGTWNMSELSTPDVEAAKVFYAAVFEWVVDRLDFGGEVGHMVRMLGYGDFLARFEPDIRERQAEAGVPPGFEDAIGWMSELPADATGEASRWGIVFAVDDADGIADKAVQLGGSVIVPPYDAGPDVRLAILADPVGAPFTINRYGPAL